MEACDDSLVGFFTTVASAAIENGEGLIFAVEDGYCMTPRSATDVFLTVDAFSAHNPDATFRSAGLAALLEDAVLPTVGVLNAAANDAESWALQTGYARDRVIAYQRCKAAAFAQSVEGVTREEQCSLHMMAASVRSDLMSCEHNVMNQTGTDTGAPQEYNAAKRSAWNELNEFDHALSMMDNANATSVSRQQIEGLATGEWDEHSACAAASDGKLGTERFVSFTFAPANHTALSDANATGGGVRCTESRLVYPAYVTVHNSKGAIEHLPATASEARPNSVIVPCSASLLCQLHALSAKAGRNHMLIAHKVRLQ